MYQYQRGSDLKNSAKEYLEGKWGTPVLTTLILAAIWMVLWMVFAAAATSWLSSKPGWDAAALPLPEGILYHLIVQLFALLMGILATLFELGCYFLYLNIICGQDYSFSNLFFAFGRDFGRALSIAAAMALVKLLCLLPYYISDFMFRQTGGVVWALLLIVFLVGGIACSLPILLALSMAPFLLLDFPQYSTRELMQHSVQLMKGNKARLFLIELSFLPLYMLCLLSFGLGYLWLMPYMQTTIVLFYLDLMKRQHSQAI